MQSRSKSPVMITRDHWIKYRKPIVITSSVIILQLIFGWDPKFFIINLIWLFF